MRGGCARRVPCEPRNASAALAEVSPWEQRASTNASAARTRNTVRVSQPRRVHGLRGAGCCVGGGGNTLCKFGIQFGELGGLGGGVPGCDDLL